MKFAAFRNTRIGKLVARVDNWNPVRDAPERDFLYIDLSSVDNQSKCITGSQRVVGRDAPSRARQLVRAGDILISTVRPNLNGVARVPREFDGATASTGFCVLRPDKNAVDGAFLFHWATTPSFIGDMVRKATGASYPAISDRIIFDSEIPLPPLGEQKRIASILDQVAELRTLRHKSIYVQSMLAKSAFMGYFGDVITNSRNWPRTTLSQVGDLDRGVSKHRPRNDPILLNGPYPLIQTGDIANCNGYISSYRSTYSDVGRRQSRLWPRGTLCITIAANIGKTGILSFDACFPDSVVGFAPGPGVRTEYIQFWMSFIQKQLEDDAPAFAQKNINLAILRDLQLPLPPLTLQDKFVEWLNVHYRTTSMMTRHADRLDTLFASLQHRAFGGELISKAAERELAEAS